MIQSFFFAYSTSFTTYLKCTTYLILIYLQKNASDLQKGLYRNIKDKHEILF